VTAQQPPAAPDLMDLLHGTWEIDRRVTDHAAGSVGTFAGVARWTPAGPGSAAPGPAGPVLAYHEHGELRFGAHRGPASRSLLYIGRPDGTVDVRFADGREFYRLDPRSGRWRARHDCGQDVYLLDARLAAGPVIQERWRVRGPGKDYEIMTTLVRVETGAGS
jgi:Family of unknown function (DUF6314)